MAPPTPPGNDIPPEDDYQFLSSPLPQPLTPNAHQQWNAPFGFATMQNTYQQFPVNPAPFQESPLRLSAFTMNTPTPPPTTPSAYAYRQVHGNGNNMTGFVPPPPVIAQPLVSQNPPPSPMFAGPGYRNFQQPSPYGMQQGGVMGGNMQNYPSQQQPAMNSQVRSLLGMQPVMQQQLMGMDQHMYNQYPQGEYFAPPMPSPHASRAQHGLLQHERAGRQQQRQTSYGDTMQSGIQMQPQAPKRRRTGGPPQQATPPSRPRNIEPRTQPAQKQPTPSSGPRNLAPRNQAERQQPTTSETGLQRQRPSVRELLRAPTPTQPTPQTTSPLDALATVAATRRPLARPSSPTAPPTPRTIQQPRTSPAPPATRPQPQIRIITDTALTWARSRVRSTGAAYHTDLSVILSNPTGEMYTTLTIDEVRAIMSSVRDDVDRAVVFMQEITGAALPLDDEWWFTVKGRAFMWAVADWESRMVLAQVEVDEETLMTWIKY